MLIEQLPIITTPKYNFPQNHHETLFPQPFLELSIRSIRGARLNRAFDGAQPCKENLETVLHKDLATKPTVQSHQLKPSMEKTIVIGVDVSSVKIGATSTGSLIALRGAVVYRQNSKYHYIRLGPFPLHVTEENKNEILSVLNCSCLENDVLGGMRFAAAPSLHGSLTIDPNLALLQTRLTSLFEDWLQKNIVASACDSLVLFDGSLTVKAGDPSASVKERILETATQNNNFILAFSKATRLRLLGHLLTDIEWKSPPPSLLEIRNLPERVGMVRFLGDIYVARLKDREYAYRLDVCRAVPQQCVEAVQRLLGNDSLTHGYPETLRLAHILSTFTANEVLGIQRYLANQCGLKIASRQNVRKMLFGPYGTGIEE